MMDPRPGRDQDHLRNRSALHVRPRKGFTLVELLIVIAIIAVLTAIAVPSYQRYQDNARLSTSISLMNTVRTDLEAYRVSHNGYPENIDFTDFKDPDGGLVVTSANKESLGQQMFSWDAYAVSEESYELTARAIDRQHTLLKLTPAGTVH